MSSLKKINTKFFSLEDLIVQSDKWKKNREKIVFTNGCFDIIHRGHIEMLSHASMLGNKLIVGLNSDSSIRNLKGEFRPILDEESRGILLAALAFIDAVILFSEETPLNIISSLKPDILVKGGDYQTNEIIGHKVVQENGGEVVIIPFINGFSTSSIIDKIKNH